MTPAHLESRMAESRSPQLVDESRAHRMATALSTGGASRAIDVAIAEGT
jgi:hypothetical protein